MCRNIKTLFNFDPPVTDDEVRAASLQFVRKITGFNKPSKAVSAELDPQHFRLSGNSYDNTMGLGASTWRHVAFIEQRVKPYGTWQGGIGENLAHSGIGVKFLSLHHTDGRQLSCKLGIVGVGRL